MREDRKLVEAVRFGGDEDAFRRLYRRHTPRLYAFSSRFLGGEGPEAEDAVQETWIRACRGLDRFRWEAAFPTWLTGIAIRVCRDRIRKRARERTEPLENAPEGSAAGNPLVRIDLERAVASLSGADREVLLLHDLEGWKHREIAACLGISEGTSKSRLSRSRARIRSLLREEGEER
ncbi:MAG: RNA polymerase sigma factor [Candidatus Eisenbacteria bacterium]|nr:RNA polymerase sigma factor [Candidatus Eisenbacteria bacterium]